MSRRHLPPNIYRDRRGTLYFRKGRGAPMIRLETQFPDGAAVPFALHQERERLMHQPIPVRAGHDIAAVIRAYKSHRKFASKAQRTRQDYEKHLLFLDEKLGKIEPRNITRRHVINWLDTWGRANAHRANYRLRILRIVLEHAIDMGLLPAGANPAKGVSELHYEKQTRTPWPIDMIAAFRTAAANETDTLLLFEMLIHLGQRIGDTRQMTWSQYDGGAFRIQQSKRGAKLWLPVPPALQALLDARPREALYIFPNRDKTGPLSYRAAHDRIMKVRKRIGAEDYDIHALRHTRASELAAAGHDDATIMSITGHKTVAALRIYTEEARQRARAEKTQEK